MNKKRFWPFLFIIPVVIAAIAGWFLLPNSLVVQVKMSGEPSKSVPKIIGLLVPVAAAILGASFASSGKAEQRPRGFIILALAAVVLVGIFAFNL